MIPLLEDSRKYSAFQLAVKKAVEGFISGVHRSPYKGFSVEFAEHKAYQTGQSTKNIDWRLFARTDKLFVKEFEAETNLRCALVLDHTPSMSFPDGKNDKLYFASFCAAAIAQILHTQRDAWSLFNIGDKLEQLGPFKSSKIHFEETLTTLSSLSEKKLSSKTNLAKNLHVLADTIPSRSLIILFSDLFDHDDKQELQQAIEHLVFRKHQIMVFHVLDTEKEVNLDFGDKKVKFSDLEKDLTVTSTSSQIKDAYKTELEKEIHDLKVLFGQSGIEYLLLDIGKDISQVLDPFLYRRQKMY